MAPKSDSKSKDDLSAQVALYQRRYERERRARKSAEQLLEHKSLELFDAYKELKGLNSSLEQKVLQRNETLTTLIKNLSTGIMLEDEHRFILLTNDLFRDLFKLNRSADELIGLNCTQVMKVISSYFKDPELYIESTERIINEGVEVFGEVLEMKNGTVLERDAVRIDSGDQFYGFLWQYKDITEQQRTQQKIRDSEEKYRGIIENMELGMLEVDLNHNIVRAYDWFCDMLGYQEHELIGKNAKQLFLPDNYDDLMNNQDTLRSEGQQSVYEVQMKRKNGSLIWVLISGAPFYDNKGNVIGSVGIHYDITDRKQLEDDLLTARNQAENAREAEKQFLANMSHEIRNPINAITGLTNLLYDTKPTKEQLEHLDNIKYSADILLGLISGILDLSKIESGNLDFVESSTNLKDVIDALIQIIGFKLEDKPVKVLQEFDPNIDFEVMADSTVLNQIFLNLLSNASKFTEEGEIKITSKLLEIEDEEALIHFEFSDTGIGIPEDKLETIFQSFRQADKETKLKYGGTGLGLSICRNLVSAYGGEIHASSMIGKGSIFYFDLRLKISQSSAAVIKQLEITSTASKKLLVVEDNKINQQYLAGLLRKWGFEYDLAENGQIALDLLDKNEYELILMDIRMPVMDGYEATIRLRNTHQNVNHNTPIIALTASALVDEKERALAAGMNYHITKPFTPEQLADALGNFDLVHQEEIEQLVDFTFSEELDNEYLDEFYQGDFERAEMMFQIFLRVMDKEIEELAALKNNEDWDAFGSQAHKIKPNFSMVGLTEISEIMKEFESAPTNADLRRDIEAKFNYFSNKFEKRRKIVETEVAKLSHFIHLV